jgi:hypothetical protein
MGFELFYDFAFIVGESMVSLLSDEEPVELMIDWRNCFGS